MADPVTAPLSRPRRSMKRFRALLASGDVVQAIVNAPFAYESRLTYAPDGFQFTMWLDDDAWIGLGPTLTDAVTDALAQHDAAALTTEASPVGAATAEKEET